MTSQTQRRKSAAMKLNDVGFRLRVARMKLRITMSVVAAEMGYTKAYLSALELGKTPWTHSLILRYRAALRKLTNNAEPKRKGNKNAKRKFVIRAS